MSLSTANLNVLVNYHMSSSDGACSTYLFDGAAQEAPSHDKGVNPNHNGFHYMFWVLSDSFSMKTGENQSHFVAYKWSDCEWFNTPNCLEKPNWKWMY